MLQTSRLMRKPAMPKEELSDIIDRVFSELNIKSRMGHCVLNTLGLPIDIDVFSACRSLTKKLKILLARMNNKLPYELIYLEKVSH